MRQSSNFRLRDEQLENKLKYVNKKCRSGEVLYIRHRGRWFESLSRQFLPFFILKVYTVAKAKQFSVHGYKWCTTKFVFLAYTRLILSEAFLAFNRVYRFLYISLPARHACLLWLPDVAACHDCLPWLSAVPICHACLLFLLALPACLPVVPACHACLPCLPAIPACLPACLCVYYLELTELTDLTAIGKLPFWATIGDW
jgi:hypothetical protein